MSRKASIDAGDVVQAIVRRASSTSNGKYERIETVLVVPSQEVEVKIAKDEQQVERQPPAEVTPNQPEVNKGAPVVVETVPTQDGPVEVKPGGCSKAVKDYFTDTPTPQDYTFGVVIHYIETLGNTYVAVEAYLTQQWLLLALTLVALILPGLLHAINTFFVLSIFKKPFKVKFRETVIAAVGLNRAFEAYRFWKKGEAPIWSLTFKDKLGNLTCCVLPAVGVNFITLLDKMEPGFAKTFLIANTCWLYFAAIMEVCTVHTCVGPPGNMQKYRYWNIETKALLHIPVTFVLDSCQMVYRLALFTCVARFAGIASLLVLIGSFSLVCTLLIRIGLQVVPAYNGFVGLMASMTGMETVLYDYCWLEPVPVYSFFIEAHFPLRVVQTGIGVWLIASNWEVRKDFDPAAWDIVFWSGVVSGCIYFTLYPLYTVLMRKEQAESFIKRDEFMSGMLEKRAKREREKRAKEAEIPSAVASIVARWLQRADSARKPAWG